MGGWKSSHCLAGATDLMLNCDIVIATEDVKIGFPPVRAQGSPPCHMWMYLVGPQWAKAMLLTGDTIDGKTAERIGLVLRAVPASELDAELEAGAGKMIDIPCELLAANKYICNKAVEVMGRDIIQKWAVETNAIAHLTHSNAEFQRIAKEKGLKAAIEERDRGVPRQQEWDT